MAGNYCMLLALACEHVHAVHADTTGIHILGCSIPHTLIIPSRAGYGVCKRVCSTRVWCTSTHEAIYSFVLVFYEYIISPCHTLGPQGIWRAYPLAEGTQGTYPHTRVHTRVWNMEHPPSSHICMEVMGKKKYIYII